MKQTTLLLVAFLFASANVFSQTTDNVDYNVWSIQPDSIYIVFAKKAYVRSDAGVSNPLIDSLAAGEKIIAKEQTKRFETVRNIYAPWVKISYTKDGAQKEGYMWLGSVAIKNTWAGNTNFLFGIDRLEKEKDASDPTSTYIKYVMQVKAVADSVIDQKEWKIDAGEAATYMDMMMLGDTKLQNLQNVVRMQAGGEACGIPTNYFYYGWTGKKFLPFPGKYSVGDAGVFYHSETLLFPHEKGGQPNKILKLTEEEEVLEEATETKKEKVKRSKSKEVYVWNGEKAIKQ